MTYQHVFAAVDLTDEADQVLEKATAVAESNGARLSIVTVVKPLAQVYSGLDLAPLANGSASFEEEATRQATEKLQKICEQYNADKRDVHVRVGSPVKEIRDAATEYEADLIVVGTHGRHGIGLLLGSTANSVLHGVDRDVLAVRVSVETS